MARDRAHSRPSDRDPPGYPSDQYTPHGYLANPSAFATSWQDGYGGSLRSTGETVGFGWLYPWALRPAAGAQLQIGVAVAGERLLHRADFTRADLVSPHHSALLFEYAWRLRGLAFRARFTLVDDDTLGLDLSAERAPDARPTDATAATLYLALVGWRGDGSTCHAKAEPDPLGGYVDLTSPYGRHRLLLEPGTGGASLLGAASSLADLVVEAPRARGTRAGSVAVGVALELALEAGPQSWQVMVRRQRDGHPRRPPAAQSGDVGARVASAVEQARRRDADFWAGAARLVGDWPLSWRRGWVYDLETTRMCIFAPGGVFADVWPSWMLQWPRAVLAEGSMDVARLAYGDPHVAMRAALSLLRDAPAPNVPCVFRGGEPNMVAADGSVCGTSPAWCVPFAHLERVYLTTVDRLWLAQIYPYLARYFDWWQRERTDPDGWAAYKCTWEAGEDDTPRLDPERRGDNVVSDYVRPVELQAAMALSAGVLERFARDLGLDEAARWGAAAEAFGERTRALWDPSAGRFRDWDRRRGRFLESAGNTDYWGVDPCRYSALAFLPLLAGLASPEQVAALTGELEEYARPPWTLWPSWSTVILEAALAAGAPGRAFARRIAPDIVGRVYDELDRRATEGLGTTPPTPGVAREYWPVDLDTWASSEGYGWGAATAAFVVRQIFGFLESPVTSGLRFRLAPNLPEPFLRSGRRYRLVNLPYRDTHLYLAYHVAAPAGSVDVSIRADRPTTCRVTDEQGRQRYATDVAQTEHEIPGRIGELYEVALGR